MTISCTTYVRVMISKNLASSIKSYIGSVRIAIPHTQVKAENMVFQHANLHIKQMHEKVMISVQANVSLVDVNPLLYSGIYRKIADLKFCGILFKFHIHE